MEIKVDVTEENYTEFYKEYGLKRNWLRKSLIIFVIGLVVLLWVQGDRSDVNWMLFTMKLLSICIVLVAVFFVIPYLLLRAKLKRIHEESSLPLSGRIYKPFATGVEVTYGEQNEFIKSEDIKRAGKAGVYVYIILKNRNYHILPLKCFSSINEALHFLNIINANVAKGREDFIRKIRFRPIYLVGIVCFIPGFGVIAAIVLIILGIVHYKDFILVGIGAAGIVTTIIFFKHLTDEATNSPEYNSAIVNMSTMDLNNLVKEIEFYKLQNGAYPDSLQQLSAKDATVFIDDPIQLFKNSKKPSKFNYAKAGNKYSLFSSGIDGIPGTKDDLYPTLTNKDTTKLGFIHKK